MKLQERGNYTVGTMTMVLQGCLDQVEGEYAGVAHPDWWAKGGKASFLNAGAINLVYQEMTRALHKNSSTRLIEL